MKVSQSKQVLGTSVMSDATLSTTYVAICDWHGKVVWVSDKNTMVKRGDLAWKHLSDDCQEQGKTTFSRVVALREEATVDVKNKRGQHFRAWFWPLESPELAVCVLSINLPKELDLLTNREREVLCLLGQGKNTRDMASELDVSVSTIHTHLRRAKEKLALTSIESLTGFAARHCYPKTAQSLIAAT